MLIEVTGTSVRNKGAELMLVAIQQRLEQTDADIEIAVDLSFGAYADRARHGLLQKVEIERLGRSRMALGLMPRSFRRSVGIVCDREIDAVLDASGFAFGDQLPLERSVRYADQVERWSSQGKPVVLLPQALGPFERPEHRRAFSRIVAAADLVYARDAVSFDHAVAAAGHPSKIRRAPDLTNLVKPGCMSARAGRKRVCVVPNTRMLEKACDEQGRKAYMNWLVNCIQLTEEQGLSPVILPHGKDDDQLVTKLCESMRRELAVEKISDPVAIKRFIGESHLLIGSRFHALLHALSQGVPALGTSWSHKYEMLFDDYAVPELLVSVDIERERLAEKLEQLNGESRTRIVGTIRDRALTLEQQAESMWREVQHIVLR